MAIERIKNDRKGELDRLMRTKGKHPDGGGLYLQVAAPGQASWVYRHKEQWKSIGPASVYKIDEARDIARNLRKEVHEKRDPFQLLERAAKPAGKAFAKAMAEYLSAKSPHWAVSNRARELRRYEFLFGQIPDLVTLPIKAIDQDAKNKALATWDAQPKARRDVSYYIEAIIRYAETGKLRLPGGSSDNHHEAMPYAQVPSFYARLAEIGTDDARALQWTILTGARTDEVIGGEVKAPAMWREITEVEGEPMWIIPGGRMIDDDFRGMKGKREHHVPLSPQMLALLGERGADDAVLFKASSQNAMLNTLKANGGNGFTVHGFRSSFSDWVVEKTNYGADLADMCIAHLTTSKVRRAYQRSPQLEKRRAIFQEWSDYVTGSVSA